MSAWETEDERVAAIQATLPTPSNTPYRTPSSGSRSSKRSSRRKSRSPITSSSVKSHANGDSNGNGTSRDFTNEEKISILDPRRFTPTLHANLVAEILSLRRDQEESQRVIENLESSLHEAQNETEELVNNLTANGKETRSLKRQLALLEGGTSSALGQLSREREDAVDATAEAKKRLDIALKKIRTQEEQSDRTHEIWSRDKESWEEEKRNLERKVHVVESRLKSVLDEVAAYEEARQTFDEESRDQDQTDGGLGHGSETGSIRSMSVANPGRCSVRSSYNAQGASKGAGVSLADELNFDTDDDDMHTDTDGLESIMSSPHRRNMSIESAMKMAHRRGESFDSLRRMGSVARGRLLAHQSVLQRLEGGIVEHDETHAMEKPVYVDTGVQFSRPSSPVRAVAKEPETATESASDNFSEEQLTNATSGHELEIEANQARKRVHASPSVLDIQKSASRMVSSASQTHLQGPLSPPRTPKSPTRPPPPPPPADVAEVPVLQMISTSTQTEAPPLPTREPPPPSPTRAAPPPPPSLTIQIPSIAVHPPTSRPATPKPSLLPQYMKDAGCQVSLPLSMSATSIGVQTEAIRVDERINLLPRHLQPSSIISNPPSPAAGGSDLDPLSSAIKFKGPPPRNPRRVSSNQSMNDGNSSSQENDRQELKDTFPGASNDDRQALQEKIRSKRSQHRSSSLYAGFDAGSSDEAEESFADADMSDADYRTILSARPKVAANRNSKRPSPMSVPEDEEPMEEAKQSPQKKQTANFDSKGTFTLREAPLILSRNEKDNVDLAAATSPTLSTARQGTMRRAALIQNGIAAHQGRAQSPLSGEIAAKAPPPFPIPTRASSRKPATSTSVPSDGNRSPVRRSADTTHRRGSRQHVRGSSVRKVRSAASVAGRRYKRPDSRSPPESPSTEAYESPRLPPLPRNNLTSPNLSEYHGSNRYTSHKHRPSQNTFATNTTAPARGDETPQIPTVVDAIAQTMIGEWMYKYVRRRKSFGIDNTIDGDGVTNGVRHRRWVWLAPYERAVMWSSKQPTTGSALMGKSGRKLAIQSVLDVKDDNPPPKGIPAVFGRSILILTPARALKFTALTQERHYAWLTALSFLAHSSQAVPEIVAAPPPSQSRNRPPLNFGAPPQRTQTRQKSFRDSIRLTKSRTAPSLSAHSEPKSAHGGGYSPAQTDNSNFSGSARGVTALSSTAEEADQGASSSFWRDSIPSEEQPAMPPVVPRFTDRDFAHSHGRKRSSTGSKIPPPLSFRGFAERSTSTPQLHQQSQQQAPSTRSGNSGRSMGHGKKMSNAGMSDITNASGDRYQSSYSQKSSSYAQSQSAWTTASVGVTGHGGMSSIRTSEADSGRPSEGGYEYGAMGDNFFDAVGMVRMEAFISPMSATRHNDKAMSETFFEEESDGGVDNGKFGRYRKSKDFISMAGNGFNGNTGFGASSKNFHDKENTGRRDRNRDGAQQRADHFGGRRTPADDDYGVRGRQRQDDPFRGF